MDGVVVVLNKAVWKINDLLNFTSRRIDVMDMRRYQSSLY